MYDNDDFHGVCNDLFFDLSYMLEIAFNRNGAAHHAAVLYRKVIKHLQTMRSMFRPNQTSVFIRRLSFCREW